MIHTEPQIIAENMLEECSNYSYNTCNHKGILPGVLGQDRALARHYEFDFSNIF